MPGPEVEKLFSYPARLGVRLFLLMGVGMPTIVGILTFMSEKSCTLGLPEPPFLVFVLMSS